MLIYTEQAAQLVAMCVLADIVAGAVDCGQRGLDEAFFFFTRWIHLLHTHTHTHTINCAVSVLWRLHSTEGDIWVGVKTWHTVRVEWLVFKSTGAKQILINHFIYLQFSARVPQLKGEVHQKREL